MPESADVANVTRAAVKITFAVLTITVLSILITLAVAIFVTIKWSRVADTNWSMSMILVTWLGMLVLGPLAPFVSLIVWFAKGKSLSKKLN